MPSLLGTFERTETIHIEASIADEDGTPTNPSTSTTISIVDPGGTTKVDASAMTNDTTGEYYYNYTPGSTLVLGLWTGKITATSGSTVSIQMFEFYLVTEAA